MARENPERKKRSGCFPDLCDRAKGTLFLRLKLGPVGAQKKIAPPMDLLYDPCHQWQPGPCSGMCTATAEHNRHFGGAASLMRGENHNAINGQSACIHRYQPQRHRFSKSSRTTSDRGATSVPWALNVCRQNTAPRFAGGSFRHLQGKPDHRGTTL